ncbi:hypothetical protein AVEN_223138-1 [Araneus ventricosus]|uniref:Secreted protein n=1 Tax=Araneus ventricosus TaxID=182803 RepID=A0A4Y2T188_ARAVE|nr:hypothetical protein AVEN_250585-1 [Araneus ventricosus]GBM89021.1 hypothetical protein AVEN_59003-1 [Araneus ventricosus]GBN92915.1 hypothetical protein AVEN_223138-1 [Araneus ventricosus]
MLPSRESYSMATLHKFSTWFFLLLAQAMQGLSQPQISSCKSGLPEIKPSFLALQPRGNRTSKWPGSGVARVITLKGPLLPLSRIPKFGL